MPALSELTIPIGHDALVARLKSLSDHWSQVQIDTPAESVVREATQPTPFRGPAEFASSPVFRLGGGYYQVVAWLPGEHPQHCTWWAEVELWVLLRRIESVARPLRIFSP
jgi:hypothetical protein